MDDPEKKVPTFYIHNNLLDSGPHKGSKQSLLGTACPNRPSLGPPQRAYTLDSSLRNCFQHPPVTPIPHNVLSLPWLVSDSRISLQGKKQRAGEAEERSLGEIYRGQRENPQAESGVPLVPAQSPGVQARTSPSRSHAPRRSDGPWTPATAPTPVPHPVPAPAKRKKPSRPTRRSPRFGFSPLPVHGA